jgi:ABC-type transport system involved in cytochrome bd biosynthesis fused ATPase/permease subunit
MAFLETILIILLIYFALKIIARLLMPWLAKYAAKKVERHIAKKFNQFQGNTTTYQERKEGEVSIDKQTKSNRKSTKKVGEYIDFEEID